MRNVWILFFTLIVGGNLRSAALDLQGQPFQASNIAVEWAAPTNGWPRALHSYNAIPQKFSAVVISNLMAIGGFTTSDKKAQRGRGSTLRFVNRDETRRMEVFPALGWVTYSDDKARAYTRERAKGVPSESETLELALRYLDKLGINRSNLVSKPGTSELLSYRNSRDRKFFDKANGEFVKEIISRGVSFVRSLEGVSMTGIGSDGGISIVFGNEGKVASLELVWPDFQPSRSHRIASPTEITEYIKQGRTKFDPPVGLDLNKGEKLTVQKVTPFYLGAPGDSEQKSVYPFGAIEAVLKLQDGAEQVPLLLKCPIISDN